MKKNYIWILFAVVCLMATLIVHQIDYYKYSLYKKSYIICSSEIEKVDEYLIKFRGQGGLTIRRAVVSYEVNEKKYTAWDIPMSYLEKEGSKILVAVDNNDYSNVLRCEFLPLSKSSKILNIIALLILLYNSIKPTIYRKVKRNKERKVLKQFNDDSVKKQKEMQVKIIEKQKKILLFCNMEGIPVQRDIGIGEVENRLGTMFSESFKWCVLSLPPTIIDWKMPLLKMGQKQFIFESETLRLREKGLPHEYYLIDKKDSYYLCCKELEERVFAFSEVLGVTKTPYEDIYDYLLEKMGSA